MAKDSAISELSPAASLRDRVESSLASAIISGELEPGTMVSVPVLAVQFGVSATPVREAMLNLEKRGFVESVKNKGFKVTEVSPQDLQEIAQLRTLLEAPAMRLVAERMPSEPVEHTERLHFASRKARSTVTSRPISMPTPPSTGACRSHRQSAARRTGCRTPSPDSNGRPCQPSIEEGCCALLKNIRTCSICSHMAMERAPSASCGITSVTCSAGGQAGTRRPPRLVTE